MLALEINKDLLGVWKKVLVVKEFSNIAGIQSVREKNTLERFL